MRGRKWVTVAVACAVVLVAATTAIAQGGVDRSFGENGVVNLDPRGTYSSPHGMQVGPDRGIYLLRTTTECGAANCSAGLYLLRRHPDGSSDIDFGEGGVVPVARNLKWSPWQSTLTIDREGRLLAAFSVPNGVSLVRLEPDGSIDRSFGQEGTATVLCVCWNSSPIVELDRRGGILLVVRYQRTGSRVVRLFRNGSEDVRFGRASGGQNPTSALVRADGSLVLAGRLESPSRPYLRRVRSDGTIDRRFDQANRRALRSLASAFVYGDFGSAEPSALIPRRDGGIDVLGGSRKRGFVLRVLPNGRLDRRFGSKGLKQLRWRMDAAVPAGNGRVFAVGDWADEPGRAFLLTAQRDLDRSFSGGQSLFLVGLKHVAGLAMQGRRPLILDVGFTGCRGGCTPEPKLMRITPLRFERDKRSGR